jgi:hypothetical protein
MEDIDYNKIDSTLEQVDEDLREIESSIKKNQKVLNID